MKTPVLETERLLLRAPQMEDFEPLCELMADEVTTRFIGGVQEPPLAWRGLCGIVGHWQLRGYGFFSVIEKASGQWLGRIGPWYPHGWPQPEIGWSLNRASWGKGYATEAGAACMDHVFDTLGWDSAIHLIHADNLGSQRVAGRLGSVHMGREVQVPGFTIMADVWGQSAGDWKDNRKRVIAGIA
ncbi:GNAT family N-acetyltransferase [uncultured Maricaulis sp.]|uniref:GNAT family N-acetyltransferase n=1 Tax=uncultured Maricaulis sp. TaxID=174710 RepID=UPI0030D9F64B|tara:strand:+ start:1262 stop:1816 length:555 start_codon:yes stop_codon:yes gene_type:complete